MCRMTEMKLRLADRVNVSRPPPRRLAQNEHHLVDVDRGVWLDDGNEDECVDGHVRCDVDEVVHQPARHVAERPAATVDTHVLNTQKFNPLDSLGRIQPGNPFFVRFLEI